MINTSPTYVMFLYWTCGMSELYISSLLQCSRSVITRIMKQYNITRRTPSEAVYEKYKRMTSEQIKDITKNANKKCRKMVETGKWILCGNNYQRPLGKDCPAYIHGNTNKKWFKTMLAREYEIKKKNQTPTLTRNEKAKIELYYTISNYLGKEFHVDHIQPISKGGLHHPDNLQIITAEDNLKKSDRLNTDIKGFRI